MRRVGRPKGVGRPKAFSKGGGMTSLQKSSFFFFFMTLEKVLKSPLGLELSDTKVYEP
jgi:hypothetical protein